MVGLNLVLSCAILAIFCHTARGQECPDGWQKYHESCYIYVPDRYNWFDATEACRMFASNLLEIEDKQENNFIKSVLITHSAETTWLGLTDFAVEGEFLSSTTQEVPEFAPWDPSQHNAPGASARDCAVLYRKNGLWREEQCENDVSPFLCEREAEEQAIG